MRQSNHVNRIKWIKWAMTAAAGCLPALAIADEPAKPENPPRKIQVEVEKVDVGQPPDLRRLQEILGARSPVEFWLDVKSEKGSYLGISASPPPAVLRKQLGLRPGMGLVVEFVVPDSPAAKAGLKQYDVLQKLDDQLLVNREQLTVLVRSHTPGDEIKVGVIRDGKPLALTAKLIEHDVEPLAVDVEQVLPLQLVFPEPRFTQIAPGQLPSVTAWKAVFDPLNVDNHRGSVTWLEGDRSYTLVTDPQGHKTFTVKAKDGKTIFEGPVNSKEEREKVPADLREKLEKLQQRSLPFGLPGANPSTQPSPLKKDADKK